MDNLWPIFTQRAPTGADDYQNTRWLHPKSVASKMFAHKSFTNRNNCPYKQFHPKIVDPIIITDWLMVAH